MKCPKCGESMRSYERNRVMIDQCEGCRGIFLDRGELEQLIDAEARFGGSAQQQQNQNQGFGGFNSGHSGGGHGGGSHGNSGGHGNNGNNGQRRGFLGGLFG